MSADVLVVEDDPGMRELLCEELSEAGHRVRAAATMGEARARLAEAPADLVVSDLRLPDGRGSELVRECAAAEPRTSLLVLTAFGSISDAVAALHGGVDDFLTKPVDLEHLRVRIDRLLDLRRLRRWVTDYRREQAGAFHAMVGRSPAMHRLFEAIRQIARAPGPVLIVGESGVGKEMVARALHAESACGEGPFVPVNCAAIPEALVESELFGHAAGAFSGAHGARRGLFEEADGGTILLDEITELPLPLQAKLLRVLQQGEVRRVGENRPRQVGVRVLAATNRDPRELLDASLLREDLYYRLETFLLEVPPLRARGEDVELLAAHFVARYRTVLDKPVEGLSAAALALLRGYPFLGNVRELSSTMQRAVAFCPGTRIEPADLPARVREQARPTSSSGGVALVAGGELPPLEEVRRRYVAHVLAQVGGNKRRAASVLGIGRRTLYRYLGE